jgi:hypothetical protein
MTGSHVLVRIHGAHNHIVSKICNLRKEIPATLYIPVKTSMSHSLPCFVTLTIMRSAINKMCRYFQDLFPVSTSEERTASVFFYPTMLAGCSSKRLPATVSWRGRPQSGCHVYVNI